MASEWPFVKLGDICDKIGSGATPKGGKDAYCSEGISLIRSQNVLDFAFSDDGLAYINDEQARKLNNVEVQSGDVLLNITGDSVARVCIVEDGYLPARVNQHVAIVRGNAKKVISSYLLYFLQMEKPHLLQLASAGATRNALTKGMIEQLELALPPLDVQRRMVAILDSLQQKIRTNNMINDNLQQQAMALYASMFLDNPALETTAGTLKDIADITMGQSPSGSSYNEDGNGEVFYQGRAEFGYRFPTRRLFTTEPKRMAEAGDVLLSVRAPVGDLNVAYERCCIGRGLGAIHGRNGYQSFVLYTMFALRPQLDVYNGEGTVFGSINRNALNDMPIDIPSEDAIAAFEAVVRPMDNMIRTNYEENCRLQELRDALLPRLMSGEVDVSDIDI